MTPQEKDLITTLLDRLKAAGGQPKDPEAEALIRQAMTEQPDAPYYLAQTVLIQDFSLHSAQNRISELEKAVADAQAQAAKPTSFLGGLFGRSEPAPPPASGSVPAAGPWAHPAPPAAAPQGQPMAPAGFAQPGYGQPMGGGMGSVFGGGAGGGGFLRQAATTAAGIAGGALLFQGIESLFGRGMGGGGFFGGQGYTPGLGETVVNNYYGSDPASDPGGTDFASSGFDPGTGQDYDPGQDSGQDFDPGQDDGSDSGGGDFSGGDSTC
ncbi:MAG TPA: DUF2076 domain-containing protein [Stellaceae bacterium]|nr:DUF2076 domain-containing protein [Stellaceae bacterium]